MATVTVNLTINYDADHADDLIPDLRQNLMNAIDNGILTGPHHEVEVDTYRLAVNEQTNFDADTFHDYVTVHGYGEPTPDGYILGHALIQTGDDYATAAFEIVARKLTTDAED